MAAVALCVVAAVTVTIVATATTPGSETSGLPALPRDLPGRVVIRTDDGTLLVSLPDGSQRTALRTGHFEGSDTPFLAEPDGSIVAVAPGGRADAFSGSDAVSRVLGQSSSVVDVAPFSDGARSVIVLTSGSGPAYSSAVSAVSIANGQAVRLGDADTAAGDPRAVGAFVAVGSTSQSAGRSVQPELVARLADTRIELRDSGHPPVVLATVAELNRAAHQASDVPVHLTLFPDADGQKVAVMLNPIEGPESNSALVVLDRRGSLLGTVRAADGPIEDTTPDWSPDGTSLAYATFGSVGTMLAVLNSSYRLATQAFEPATGIEGCTWSPDSRWVLCLATSTYTEYWLLGTNDGTLTPVYFVQASGSPVAWLP